MHISSNNRVEVVGRRRDARSLELPRWRGFVSATVFLASLALVAAGWFIKGDVDQAVRPDSDDFVRAGELMIHWIVTGGAGFEVMQSEVLFPYYFLPSVILAGIYMYFSDPVVKVVALNCMLFSGIVVLMYQFWMSVHGPWREWWGKRGFLVAGVGGFYVVFGLPDPFLYSYTVLTDVIFLFWVAVFVVAASRGIVQGGAIFWLVAGFMALTAPYVRPTGMVLPVLFLFAVIVSVLRKRDINLRPIACISIGLPLAIMLFLVPWLVAEKINGSPTVNAIIPDLLQREFNQAVYFFKTGIIVSDRPDTAVESPSSYIDVLKMIVYRMGYYLVPLRFGDMPYTLAHNVMNLVYILVVWPLTVVGIRRLVLTDRRCRVVALFLVMVALSYLLLHSVTLLSFGWRYQLPAMVPLWMLAGVGLYSLLGRPAGCRESAAQTGTLS